MIFIYFLIKWRHQILTSPGGTDYFGHLTQLSVVAPVWAGTRKHLIVMNMHLQWIKETTAEIPLGKAKGPWCFTTDPNETWKYFNIPCIVSTQMITWIKYATFIAWYSAKS